ncbi:glycosyltransferase family 2 protein [Phenylobacterium deserti]|uniref:Glycosyltransferase family 2 protein n=1 Tax=Phenylobacterium deserti TaxID=1914756 RepID=A0A328ATQ6_9CAUL|nr:glycosyltransferase family 2 protein [Phenylobacterium deserti]RAK57066.1 glycosyltransferase family 2 protein [Phenylobacterium deserti]
MARERAKDKGAEPRVSVVVVAYESGPLLAECLASLKAQTVTDHEVILIDNASKDPAARDAAAADSSLIFVGNSENLGFAAACNQGARIARGRWIAFLNPDAVARPDWLEQLLAATERFAGVRAFASRQLLAEDTSKLDGLGDVMSSAGFPFRGGYLQPDLGRTEPGEVFSACGGAMLIDRELFLALGGFDERLFCYCEDVDLGYRLRLQGEPTVVIPQAVVTHVGSASSGGPRSDFATFYGTRNRLWVFIKNTPPLLLLLTWPLHLAATALLFARHATRGELRSPWRGFVFGLKNIGVALEARREAQAARKVGSLDIARAMTWNPKDLFGRRVVIKPLGSSGRS